VPVMFLGVGNVFNDVTCCEYGPGVDLACNRNEYQEFLLGGGGGERGAGHRAGKLTTFMWQRF
jgi:hypothetical protein